MLCAGKQFVQNRRGEREKIVFVKYILVWMEIIRNYYGIYWSAWNLFVFFEDQFSILLGQLGGPRSLGFIEIIR